MTLITINVQNDNPKTQSFLYFMSPGQGGSAASWYCTSLGTALLGNYAQTGTILTFMLNFDYYAGVQQAYTQPTQGQQSGFYSACQSVELSTGNGQTADTTVMSVNPLGLSPAVPGSNVPAGNFRISTATYNSSASIYNAGTALRTSSGGVVLPTFIVASPNMNITIAPTKIFNLSVGSAATGTVVDPASFLCVGTCDATAYTSFQAVYTANGTWDVTPSIMPISMASMSAQAAVLAPPPPSVMAADGGGAPPADDPPPGAEETPADTLSPTEATSAETQSRTQIIVWL